MKVHRFYVGSLHDKRGKLDLAKKVWVHDEHLLRQWLKVLRLRVREEVVLFDGEQVNRLYRIVVIQPGAVCLELVTELELVKPVRHTYLLWSLLKKDKNDLVLQKCTELGITNFVPIISRRTEKTGFDIERAHRIVIEAAEQCGRSDIPHIREPLILQEAIAEYSEKVDLYICEQESTESIQFADKPVGVFIGPEGGWTDQEKQLFAQHKLKHINIAVHTLRAETAAITVAARLLQ